MTRGLFPTLPVLRLDGFRGSQLYRSALAVAQNFEEYEVTLAVKSQADMARATVDLTSMRSRGPKMDLYKSPLLSFDSEDLNILRVCCSSPR